jgi:hypothetical protein
VLLRLRRLKIASFDDAAPAIVTITTARFYEFLEFLEQPPRPRESSASIPAGAD